MSQFQESNFQKQGFLQKAIHSIMKQNTVFFAPTTTEADLSSIG